MRKPSRGRERPHGPGAPQRVVESRAAPPDNEAGHTAAAEDRATERATLSHVLAARFFWLLLGPLSLVLVTVGIMNAGTGWLTALDASFFVLVLAMIGCRWLEMRSGQATTGTGEPATWSDFRRYVAVLLPLAAGVWCAANVLGNYVFSGNGQ